MSDNSYSLNARCARCKISAEQVMFAEKRQMSDCLHYWVEPQQRYAAPIKPVIASVSTNVNTGAPTDQVNTPT